MSNMDSFERIFLQARQVFWMLSVGFVTFGIFTLFYFRQRASYRGGEPHWEGIKVLKEPRDSEPEVE
jgi:hypothetical protein